MRGRKPAQIALKSNDKSALQQILRDGPTPLRVTRRAQILLRRAQAQQRAKPLGEIVVQDAVSIWRVCERYTCPTGEVGARRQDGLKAALYDARRFFSQTRALGD